MAWCICGLNDALNGRRHNCRHPDGPRWSEIDPHKAAPEPVAVLTAIHAFDDLYPTKPANESTVPVPNHAPIPPRLRNSSPYTPYTFPAEFTGRIFLSLFL